MRRMPKARAKRARKGDAPPPANLFAMLPDVVVSRVLSFVGLLKAVQLRAICKQWRRAFDTALWERVEVAVEEPKRLQALARRIQAGQLQLATQPSVELRLKCEVPSQGPGMYRQAFDHLAASAAFLVQCTRTAASRSIASSSTIAGATTSCNAQQRRRLASTSASASTSSGSVRAPAGIRSLRVTLEVPEYDEDEEEDLELPSSALCGLVFGTLASLRAIAPRDPPAHDHEAAAAQPLTELAIDVYEANFEEWAPSPAELLLSMSPFRCLQSFSLFPTSNYPSAMSGPAAAAIVQCCPLLRSVLFRPKDGTAVAALAPLASLEEVTLLGPSSHEFDWDDRTLDLDIRGGPTALGAGPAGRSIRIFSPKRYALVASADIRGFGCMPLLEKIARLKIDEGVSPIAREDAAALSGAKRLRCLEVDVYTSTAAADGADGFLNGLADAMSTLTSSTPPTLQLAIAIHGAMHTPNLEP